MKAFIASRKGLLVYKKQGSSWKLERSHFDGVRATYVSFDPHAKKVWAGITHGHWGPKVHFSSDKGKTFTEVASPKLPGASEGANGVRDIWAIAADKKGRIYVGTDPANLFHSDDGGQTWQLNQALHEIHGRDKWMGGGSDGPCLHSILIHPEDHNKIVIGVSVAGVLSSNDRGKSWSYSNKGLKAYYLPDPDAPFGQDPHIVKRSASDPNVLWQQNHCGIFKSEDGGQSWQDLSKAKGVKTAFGWAVVIDEKDAGTAYTLPALSDETRVPWKKKLIVQKTTNGGKSWVVQAKGLPQKNCYDIIYRHAFSGAGGQLLFGTTTGHIWFSGNKGQKWSQVKDSLAPIYSVKLVDF